MYFKDSDVVAIGAASAQSETVPANIHKAMLTSTIGCWVAYGTSPTASAADGSFYLPAGTELVLSVHPGQRFAVIQATTAGSLSVAWLS
jgi:hypothetical protein